MISFFKKLVLLVTPVAAGGLAGMWAIPSDVAGRITSPEGIYYILGGMVGGFFLGSLFALLCD